MLTGLTDELRSDKDLDKTRKNGVAVDYLVLKRDNSTELNKRKRSLYNVK